MIDSINVRNFAVVRVIEIRPCAGFSAITGETGAGKTVIAESLGFILGRRTSPELIRSGEKSASVCVAFSDIPEDVSNELRDCGIETEEDSVLFERTLYADGKSSARINSKPVSLKTLSTITSRLLSMHGQRDTVLYLSPEARRNVLDGAASDGELLDECRAAYSEWKRLKNEIASLRASAAKTEEELDLLKFRYREIGGAKLQPGEDEKLEAERDAIRSSEKIRKQGDAALRALYKNEKGITAPYLTMRAADSLEKIGGLVPGTEEIVERLREIGYELEETAAALNDKLNAALPEDPGARLDEIEERITLLSRLKRKYGCDLDGLIRIARESAESIKAAGEAKERIASLEKELAAAEKNLGKASAALSEARAEAAGKLTESVLAVLGYLDLQGAEFEIRVRGGGSYGPAGYDAVDFMFSANKGEPALPIENCASGGELARLVLALKTVLAGFAGGMTLFFDEIDTGISGSTSRRIGLLLRRIGSSSQTICITHSAQIASLADAHFRVGKRIVDGRTESCVEELDREGRISEISRILGGIDVTAAQRMAAIDMIDNTETDLKI